jgi:hypothetical protein
MDCVSTIEFGMGSGGGALLCSASISPTRTFPRTAIGLGWLWIASGSISVSDVLSKFWVAGRTILRSALVVSSTRLEVTKVRAVVFESVRLTRRC